MPLAPGSRLGPYEVLAAIGAGGMGEVYRARDSKLNRDVAIKVLPPIFAHDNDRMARLQREAQLLASLNHTNIAQIYGMEGSALVMEFVPGETPQGPLPVDEAMAICRQIAEALEYAHDKGIVHRDLKPANLKVTPDGTVKVLDFGLAKALEEGPVSQDISNSPTRSLVATKAGVIWGTPAYMSPEQARGKSIGKRADIWAFGCVLYELLTGKRAFEGDTVIDVMAAVVGKEPDWAALPPGSPGELLRLCLRKDPKLRLRDIGDLTLVTTTSISVAPSSLDVGTWSSPGRERAAWILAGVLGLVLAVVAGIHWWPAHPALRPLQRLELDPGAEALNLTRPGSDAILSPDGTRLVTYGRGADGQTRLYTRLLEQAQSVPLPGTEGAWDMFFSPDGQWLGFYARRENKLKKISVQGGAAVTLCEARQFFGGSWGEDGDIIASLDGRVLSRIPSAGGEPRPVTQLNKQTGETAQRYPQVLPGGQAVLFTSHTATSNFDQANVEVQALKTGRRKTMVHGGFYGRFVPTGPGSGHLLYLHQATLFATPMKLAGLELIGPAAPVLEGVRSFSGGGSADLSVSLNGTLVFIAGGNAVSQRTIVWLDSAGKTTPIRAASASYLAPRLSPDGKRLAISIFDGANNDIYAFEMARDTMQRLTFTPGLNSDPAWAPDGKHLAFCSNRSGPQNIYWVRGDGAGEVQRLTESKNNQSLPSFAADGKHLTFVEQGSEGRTEIWTLGLDLSDPDRPKHGKPELFLRTAFNENAPAFSPDGRWLAYQSNEASSGVNQVYVRPFPQSPERSGGKWQVSTEGGSLPAWSRNGRELFYRFDNRIMVAAYTGKGDAFMSDKPRPWANKQFRSEISITFDPAPDGKRIAVSASPETGEQQSSSRVSFLLNFFDELQRRAPGKN